MRKWWKSSSSSPITSVSLTLISRRLEGYLRGHDVEAFAADTAIEAYLDAISGIIDAGVEPQDDALDAILDGLAPPTKSE